MKTIKLIITCLLCLLVYERAGAQCTTLVNGVLQPCIKWQDWIPTGADFQTRPTYTIRVTVHSLSKADGTMGIPNDAAGQQYIQTVIDSMNLRYSRLQKPSHISKIYPTPYISDARIVLKLENIYYHPNDTFYLVSSGTVAPLAFQAWNRFVNNSSALSAFDKDSTLHIFFGHSTGGNSISSSDKRYIYVSTTYNSYPATPAAPARDIGHELGHSMKLEHVFWEDRTDDDMEDVPPVDRAVSNNYMDYAPSYGYAFSAQQVGKMWYVLDGNLNNMSDVVEKTWCNFNSSETITIPAGTTHWSSPRRVNGNIVVPAGAELVISGTTISIPPTGRITVERGGKLNISFSTITNVCGKIWDGIVVYGNRDSASIEQYQGTVQIMNSVIEHAKFGVYMGAGSGGAAYSGGICTAAYTTFLNCTQAVEWSAYANYMPGVNQLEDCDFICTEDIGNTGTGTGNFVRMEGVKNIRIKGCRFKGRHADASGYRGTGIYAENSSFTVLPLDPNNGGGCFQWNGAPSSFDSLSTGIYVKGDYVDNASNLKVLQTKFFNTRRGIVAKRNTGAHIWHNNFTWNDSIPPCSACGPVVSAIEMDSSTAFKIYENDILLDSVVAGTADSSQVMIIRRSVADDTARIYRNTTLKIPDGSAVGIGLVSIGTQSLNIACNSYTGLHTDWLIKTDSLNPQGTMAKPAGNVFSASANPNIDQDNPGKTTPIYFASNQNPAEQPVYTPSGGMSPTLTSATDRWCDDDSACLGTEPQRPVFLAEKAKGAAIEDAAGMFRLYPNPFREFAIFEYRLPVQAAQAWLLLYDVTGKLVLQARLNGPEGRLELQGGSLPSGIYQYRIAADGQALGAGRAVINR